MMLMMLLIIPSLFLFFFLIFFSHCRCHFNLQSLIWNVWINLPQVLFAQSFILLYPGLYLKAASHSFHIESAVLLKVWQITQGHLSGFRDALWFLERPIYAPNEFSELFSWTLRHINDFMMGLYLSVKV